MLRDKNHSEVRSLSHCLLAMQSPVHIRVCKLSSEGGGGLCIECTCARDHTVSMQGPPRGLGGSSADMCRVPQGQHGGLIRGALQTCAGDDMVSRGGVCP